MHDANGCHIDNSNPEEPKYALFSWLQLSFKCLGHFQSVRKLLSQVETDPETGWERRKSGPVNLTISTAQTIKVEVVEDRIDAVQHFVQIHGLHPGGHVQVDHYDVVGLGNRATYSDLEVCCAYSPRQQSPFLKLENDSIFPIPVWSFDIECHSDKTHWRDPNKHEFPRPENPGDAVVYVCGTLWNPTTDEREKVSFALGDHGAPQDDTITCYRYDTEQELLEAVRDWCLLRGVIMYVGYNIKGFDFWYMYERMETLRPSSRFFFFNNLARTKSTFPRKSKCPRMPGCIVLDLLPLFRQRLKLDTYTLDAVCMFALGKKKIDMPAAQQFRYYDSGDLKLRAKIVDYCMRDTYLPIELMKHFLTLEDLLELSKVTGAFMDDLLSRGQMFRVVSLLFIKLRESQFAMSNLKFVDAFGYKGATVLDVLSGYYHNLAVLDFQALYPSIIRACNLCYCTLVDPDAPRYPNVEYKTICTPIGEQTFVQNLPGILPKVCADLLDARGRAKKQLKKYKAQLKALPEDADPQEVKRLKRLVAVYDARQRNLKITCNSIYGFAGTAPKMNSWSCLQIAASTTTIGRQLIDQSKLWAEGEFQELDAKVVAGDTDSIFVLFNLPATEAGFRESFAVATRLADRITERFRTEVGDTIILEFEKIYKRVILMVKKNYVGYAYEGADEKPKIDAKGVAGVRRSFAIFQRNVFWDVVNALLVENKLHKSLQILDAKFTQLLEHKVPFEELILTCQLAREYKDPCNAVAQRIADLIESRQPGYGPVPGDRVAYVLIKSSNEKAKKCDIVEDAQYIQDQGLEKTLDYGKYIDALKTTMTKLFKCFDAPTKRRVNEIFRDAMGHAYREANSMRTISSFFTSRPAVDLTIPVKVETPAVVTPPIPVKVKRERSSHRSAPVTTKKARTNYFQVATGSKLVTAQPKMKKATKKRRREAKEKARPDASTQTRCYFKRVKN